MRNFRRTIRNILVKLTIWIYPIEWELEDIQKITSRFSADLLTKRWVAESLKNAIHTKGKGKYQIN